MRVIRCPLFVAKTHLESKRHWGEVNTESMTPYARLLDLSARYFFRLTHRLVLRGGRVMRFERGETLASARQLLFRHRLREARRRRKAEDWHLRAAHTTMSADQRAEMEAWLTVPENRLAFAAEERVTIQIRWALQRHKFNVDEYLLGMKQLEEQTNDNSS